MALEIMPLTIDKLVKTFGETRAVDRVNLDVRDGEFFVILGPSGCGKTTFLRCIAGLETPDSGRIILNGKNITQDSPSGRDTAFVFQQPVYLPNKTVAENIAYPLVCKQNSLWQLVRGGLSNEQRGVAQQLGQRLRIGELLDRYPQTLSGGQLQRLSLGRALAKNAAVVLFDEPLANLDLRLRDTLRAELLRIKEEMSDSQKCAMIYVTHEQEDALFLADRLAIMREGKFVQVGTAEEIYTNPVDSFTASFVGSPQINLLPGVVTMVESSCLLKVFGRDMQISRQARNFSAERTTRLDVLVGIRPQELRLDETGRFEGEVTRSINFFSYQVLWVRVDDKDVRLIDTENSRKSVGQKVRFSANEESLLIFHADTGLRVV